MLLFKVFPLILISSVYVNTAAMFIGLELCLTLLLDIGGAHY